MIKKIAVIASEDEVDSSTGAARPVRPRRGAKRKVVAKSRKSRRKAAAAPGGIHQRANKRLSW